MAVSMGAVGKSELTMSSDGNETSVAAFIAKVWKIVNKKEYEDLISWSDVRKTGRRLRHGL